MLMSVDPKCFLSLPLLSFCCKHVQSHKEENNASRDLERRFRDLQVGQYPSRTESEEEYNNGTASPLSSSASRSLPASDDA